MTDPIQEQLDARHRKIECASPQLLVGLAWEYAQENAALRRLCGAAAQLLRELAKDSAGYELGGECDRAYLAGRLELAGRGKEVPVRGWARDAREGDAVKAKKTARRLAIEYEARLYLRWMKLERSAHEPWPEAEIRNAYLAGFRAAKREKGRK